MSAAATFGPPMPVRLDDVTFFNFRQEAETAWRNCELVGEIDQDEINHWCARKRMPGDAGYLGEWTPWRPMRCLAEARAFVVSRRRTI